MTDTPKSPDHETVQLAIGLRNGLRHAVYLMRRLDTEGDWTTTQISVMNMVAEEPLRMNEIAANTGTRMPSVTELVNRLEGAGLVVRLSDPNDARGVLVDITARGRTALERVNRERNEFLAARLERLDPDERQALRDCLPALDHLIALGEMDRPNP